MNKINFKSSIMQEIRKRLCKIFHEKKIFQNHDLLKDNSLGGTEAGVNREMRMAQELMSRPQIRPKER